MTCSPPITRHASWQGRATMGDGDSDYPSRGHSEGHAYHAR